MWFFVGSHGFREIQQEDYLWEFVLIRGRKNLYKKNICVIRGICGFKANPQIFTDYLWAKRSVSQYFYIPLPIYVPKILRVMTDSNPYRHIKKRLMKTVGAHTPCSCGYMQGT